ncbi:MAG: hypothetical protein K2Y37_14805 [Pirellulales bacterium]|nr:hypothetical protein [Pirellulales bacterium]
MAKPKPAAKPAAKPASAPPAAGPTSMADVLAAIDALAVRQQAIDASDQDLAYLPADYAALARRLVDTLAAYPGPPPFERAEALALACRVATLWHDHETAPADEWPPAEFYAFRARLDELVRWPSVRPPSIATLAERKTNPRQIAVIWGLVNTAGQPDVDRVERLLAGQEQLPAGYEPADAARAILAASEALARLRAHVAATARPAEPPSPEPGSPEALEAPDWTAATLAAIEELAAAGLTSEEIALELDLDPERVASHRAGAAA